MHCLDLPEHINVGNILLSILPNYLFQLHHKHLTKYLFVYLTLWA